MTVDAISVKGLKGNVHVLGGVKSVRKDIWRLLRLENEYGLNLMPLGSLSTGRCRYTIVPRWHFIDWDSRRETSFDSRDMTLSALATLAVARPSSLPACFLFAS